MPPQRNGLGRRDPKPDLRGRETAGQQPADPGRGKRKGPLSAHPLADQFQVARSALVKRDIGGLIARTAGFNVAAAAAAALGGVVIARTVGPTVRGEYAAVTAWFGLLLIVGGVGQPAAVCFHVARDPERARGYVATSRAMMLVTGAIALTAGLVVAPVLAHGHPGLAGAYRIAFAGSALAFVGASYTSSLQATSTPRWNFVRVSQPILALTAILLLRRIRLLTLDTALGVLIVTMAIQLGYAYYWCRRSKLAPGHARVDLIRPLVRYGMAQIAALTPSAVNAYLDQLVLSQLVPPADLGRYAIAVSITLVPVPLVSAIGNVAFPRLAASRAIPAAGRGLPLTALLVSAVTASAILLPIAAIAFWLIPEVFGPAYRGAVPLLWILTPGGIFLACSGVVGDLLRGLGLPGRVAAAQGLAAVFTVILLFALLPSTGVAAAAIASTVSYGVALAVMIRWLWRPPRTAEARHRRYQRAWP
jgi:O-antigen/teichoic acid export membrane protein